MGNSALIGVSFKGNLEIVKLLVDNKARLDIQNNTGSTALIYSAMYKNKEVYDFLISAGANKELKDKKRKTDLDYAQENGLLNDF